MENYNKIPSDITTVSSDNEEIPEWVVIQMTTFTNWLNYQLRQSNVVVRDLCTDLSDGTLLIQIVEIFQRRICTGKIYNYKPTEIQCLMNVQMALDALREDGVKLVNIGSQDIVEGNLKLILGLIWCLIQKYQISIQSKIPPKKLIMAWLQSVLPEIKLTNFRTNWNTGKALAALINYCQPGLFEDWRNLDPNNSYENCKKGLELAEKYLNVPSVLNAEHMSSPELDELSTITYLSFFVAENGPGYIASLHNCSKLMPDVRITNFDRSWNDGYLFCKLIISVGGEISNFNSMNFNDPNYWITNISIALSAASQLGIVSLLGPNDLADPDVEYLGVMALVAALCSLTINDTYEELPTPPPSIYYQQYFSNEKKNDHNKINIFSETITTSCYQDQQINLDLAFQENSGLTINDLDVIVIGPNNKVKDHKTLFLVKVKTSKGAVLSFVPDQIGDYQVRILCQGSELPSSPILLTVLPSTDKNFYQESESNLIEETYQFLPETTNNYNNQIIVEKALFNQEKNNEKEGYSGVSKIMKSHSNIARVSFSGLSEPCSVGSTVEVVINAHGTDNNTDAIRVTSTSPSGITKDCHVTCDTSSFTATFSPNEVGEWKIGIFYNYEHIHGSPFSCNVFDPNAVDVYGLDVGLVGQELKFTINTKKAGNGKIDLDVIRYGKSIPYHLESDNYHEGIYKANFTPDGSGQYKIHIMLNGVEIRGSPYVLDIADASSISVYGDNLKMGAVGKGATFMIHAANADTKDITVLITDSHKEKIHAQIYEEKDNVKRVEFIPLRVGDHDISILYGGQEIPNSPFTCRAYDPTKIVVGNIPNGTIDKAVHFVVDASSAGVGNLEVAVNEGKVPSMAHALGQHKYDISFIPKEEKDHTITIRFNNEYIPGSPFICHLVAPSYASATGPGLERIQVGNKVHFIINVTGTEVNELPVVKIIDPQGLELPCNISNAKDEKNTFIAEYIPNCIGNHRIEVLYDNEPINGSPFISKAFDANKAKLSLLTDAIINKECNFMIDAGKAGAGNMEIIVSVNEKNVPNFVRAEGQAKFKVSFTPQELKDHYISVKFNGIPVPGSPLRCQVKEDTENILSPVSDIPPISRKKEKSTDSTINTVYNNSKITKLDDNSKLLKEIKVVGDITQGIVGKVKGFSIDGEKKGLECNVVITDPNNGPVPVKCFKQQDEGYWVEFTPEIVGKHVIDVSVGDQKVYGSPFYCKVIDPKEIKIVGFNNKVLINQGIQYTIRKKDAGEGDVKIEISDPENHSVVFNKVKDYNNDDIITFLPTKLGEYKINLKMNGFQVNGYPKSIIVERESKPQVFSKGLTHGIDIDEDAHLLFDPKHSQGGIKIHVSGPDNEKIRHVTKRNDDGTSTISFKPSYPGIYNINIDFNNKPIEGSPFKYYVVDSKNVIIDDENVDSNGVLGIQLNKQNSINVDGTAAGPGRLTVEVKNKFNEIVDDITTIDSFGEGKYRVNITPRYDDEYKIYFYWSGNPVPGFYPIIASTVGICKPKQIHTEKIITSSTTYNYSLSSPEVILRGRGAELGVNGEPNEFMIEFNKPININELSIVLAGDKADIPVKLNYIGNNIYKATYVPKFPGNYTLSIFSNGNEFFTSQEPIRIQDLKSPADRVLVDFKKLKIGIIDEEMTSLIDTRDAEPGKLSVKCQGPTSTQDIMLKDNMDGTYFLSFYPKELGKHTLTIKYADQHVPGSPLSFNVSLPPDASKVKVYGSGIQHGILNNYKSDFIVETKGAGAGQLTVRVRGPKGAFNVEMQRDTKNDRTIHCKYEPKEPGDYQVEIKWHGKHVPGSPFFVMIVDTEQELQRFLMGEAPSPQPPGPFVPPGWVGGPLPPINGQIYNSGYPQMIPPPPPHLLHGPPLPIPPHRGIPPQPIMYSPNRRRFMPR